MTMFQYWHGSEGTKILILGFTLAIAVFESITAISDGCEKMKKRAIRLPGDAHLTKELSNEQY